jgi:hypothetical protein
MHAARVSPRMAVVLGLLAAIGVTGCTANSAPSSVAAPTSQSASPAASAPASPPAVTSSATPASSASATPSSSGGVQNLAVNAAVRSELVTAFAAAKSISLSDVAGSRPGSVFYGFDPATETYWAMANYEPSSTDPLAVTVSFQDGASIGFFKKVGSGPWQATIGGAPAICAELRFFPQKVLEAWSLPTSSPAPC